MADAVTTQTIVDGQKEAAFKFTNISDGTGESAVVKVDVSSLAKEHVTQNACTKFTIDQIWWQCVGMKVQLLFDATSNALVIILHLFYQFVQFVDRIITSNIVVMVATRHRVRQIC